MYYQNITQVPRGKSVNMGGGQPSDLEQGNLTFRSLSGPTWQMGVEMLIASPPGGGLIWISGTALSQN